MQAAHRFVCITDDPEGIDHDVEIVELPAFYANMQGCYPKIMLFCRETQELFDDRILYMDLDCVVTGPLDGLLPNGDADLLIHAKPLRFSVWEVLRSKAKRRQKRFYKAGFKYNAGLMMLRKYAHTQLCENFDEEKAGNLQQYYHVHGEDQVWIAHNIGFHKDVWTKGHGVYSYVSDMAGRKRANLPEDVRIVMFGGSHKPWDEKVLEASPWIREHYPLGLL